MVKNNIRKILEDRENSFSKFASKSYLNIGRDIKEKSCQFRTEYQRDRDRILHSKAFRRLKHKTHVFISPLGDHFVTRLTHTLEVSQISRGIARTLNCHEDLAEAIALAHDLGHTPFGHAGQDSLNSCMKDFGGFEHNLQSLRVVDLLEQRYVNFDGLNLTFETREGILKHCSTKNAKNLGAIGERFIKKQQPSLEAQLVNYADEIAYNIHDIDVFDTIECKKSCELCNNDIINRIDYVLIGYIFVDDHYDPITPPTSPRQN